VRRKMGVGRRWRDGDAREGEGIVMVDREERSGEEGDLVVEGNGYGKGDGGVGV
jgi:hypothetical protein